MLIQRPALIEQIRQATHRSRVVALLGPRQSGKTTLAREFVPPDTLNYFDLEDPVSLARLDQPLTALSGLTGLVVIDEMQRRPDLFPILRVLADRQPLPAHFLILGSASPDLIQGSSESLAGRLETIFISGFSLSELGAVAQRQHWLRGGFPPSFLAASDEDSFAWRKNFVQTFLERDLLELGVRTPAATIIRFWTLLAHYHGQVWNAAELARALGVSQPTVRRYLDLLQGLFMIRQLQPWHANLSKRQVKSPKLFFRDSGLLHYLLGARTQLELESHPRSGASWEGYVIEEVLKRAAPDEAYFWASHNGAEVDLLLLTAGRKIGVECKRVDAPRLTASMQTACDDLQLDHLTVIYPGNRSYPLSDHVTVVPLAALAEAGTAALFGSA